MQAEGQVWLMDYSLLTPDFWSNTVGLHQEVFIGILFMTSFNILFR